MSSDRRPLDPQAWDAWRRIFRDFICVLVGAFMLIWATVFQHPPNYLIVGGGLLALGLPLPFRVIENGRNGGKED